MAEFVDSKNTEGSGDRWYDKVILEIERVAQSKVLLVICKNAALAKLSYRCFTYNDWVIAYKVKGSKFIVCRFIYGARLK